MSKNTKKKDNGFLEKEVKILSHLNEISAALNEIYLKSPKDKPTLISFSFVKHSNYIFKMNNKTVKLRKYLPAGKGKALGYELIVKKKTGNGKSGLKERIEKQTKITKETYEGIEEFIKLVLPRGYHKYTMDKLRYSFDKFVVDICKVKSKDSKEEIPSYIEIELKNNKNDLEDIKKFIKKLCPSVDVSKLVFSTKGVTNLKK